MNLISVLTLIVSFILSRFWYAYDKRCRSCGKLNALILQEEKYKREEQRERKETYTDTIERDHKGRVIKKIEKTRFVPYKVRIYDKIYECKYCENEYIREFEGSSRLGDGATSVFIIGLIVSMFLFYMGNKKQNQIKSSPQNQPLITIPTTKITKEQRGSKRPVVTNKHPITYKTKNKFQSDSSQQIDSNKIFNKISENREETITTDENKKNQEKQIQESGIKITEETPKYKKQEYAINMLIRGKSIGEIADSTFLSKREIRKLKRKYKKGNITLEEDKIIEE